MALRQAPGVLAVKVDYNTRTAVMGTRLGETVPREAILQALNSIGYSGQFREADK
jgi:hypothetical protein